MLDVVQRELLPEINTLLGLAHPNLVRLRCVGLRASNIILGVGGNGNGNGNGNGGAGAGAGAAAGKKGAAAAAPQQQQQLLSFPAYVAMDFCEDGTLRQWIDERRVSGVLAVVFLGDLVAGMACVFGVWCLAFGCLAFAL